MDKELTLRAFIGKVENSVKSGNIDKKYPLLLKECLELGQSSYMLNVLINSYSEARPEEKKDSRVEYDSLMESFPVVSEKETVEVVKEKLIKVKNKTNWIAWGIAVLASVGCILLLLALYGVFVEEDSLGGQLTEVKDADLIKYYALKDIAELSGNRSNKRSFDSWTSTNHEDNTESRIDYNFIAEEGDELSFDYFVSSESGCDFLSVFLDCDSASSIMVLRTSGIKSGSCTFSLNNSGNYNLRAEYKKDYSLSRNSDEVRLTNICIHDGFKFKLDSINSIANRFIETSYDY